MKDSDPKENGRAVYFLVRAKRQGDVETLRTTLKSDATERRIAARYLGDLGATEAISEIRPLLSSDWWRERLGAVRALGQLKDRESLPTLLEMMVSDPQRQVRLWATAAVGEIGDPAALPALLERLESDDPSVRRSAAYALGALGDRRAREPLQRAARLAPFWRRGIYRRALQAIIDPSQ